MTKIPSSLTSKSAIPGLTTPEKLLSWDQPKPRKAKVFLGIPFSLNLYPGVLGAVLHATEKRHDVVVMTSCSGCLPHNFNTLFFEAYNRNQDGAGFTHFAMFHSDVRAKNYWLDTLIEEMDAHDADIMSAAVAIKDDRGLVSMGIQKPGTWDVRRFTTKELHEMPETFSIADTTQPDHWLAINVGCVVCRLGENWIHKFSGFHVQNAVNVVEGKRYPTFYSEDWEWSGWAHREGLRVFATRKVNTWHTGNREYPTDHVWGDWTIDEECVDYQLGGLREGDTSMMSQKEVNHGGSSLASAGREPISAVGCGEQQLHSDRSAS